MSTTETESMADITFEAALVQRQKVLAAEDPQTIEDVRRTALATIDDIVGEGVEIPRAFVDGVLATAFNMGILLAAAIRLDESNEAMENLATITAMIAWEIAAIYQERQA